MDLRNICKQTLTPEQQKQYDAVRWLIGNGSRASGRTRVLIAALIDESLESGDVVRIHDHTMFTLGFSNKEHLMSVIKDISEILGKHIKIEVSNKLEERILLRAKYI